MAFLGTLGRAASSVGMAGNMAGGLMGGGKGLAASQAAMQMMDSTSAATTMMNAHAQTQKMATDTTNSIANAYVDSANKSNNAATNSGKAINY